jgi:hypothetical protein
MNKTMKNIVDLLPEGLSEDSVTQIASLVNDVIVEEVESRVNTLETKVKGFLRLKIDELKEHALVELRHDSEFVKNAHLFESIKSLMAVELTEQDDERAINTMLREHEEISDEREVLIQELNKSLALNEELEQLLGTLSGKMDSLEEEKERLVENVTRLEESNEQPFKSSEKAQVIAENIAAQKKPAHSNNEFLTDEVMAFMPFNTNRS